jgi:hypothetical protein
MKQKGTDWLTLSSHVVGIILAGASLVLLTLHKQEIFALPVIGILLVFYWWHISRDLKIQIATIDARITELVKYERLTSHEHIWTAAEDILTESQPDDSILSTASLPNDPKFEEAVFRRVVHNRLIYKRLLCYVDEGAEDKHAGFPSIDDIKGDTDGDLLESYCAWYSIFYVAWSASLSDRSGRLASLGMKQWHAALDKLGRFNGFEVRFHGSEIATDYFIFEPHGDRPAKAVVGFPKKRGEGMWGGLAITDSLLAKDLGMNWQRLWDRKPPDAAGHP